MKICTNSILLNLSYLQKNVKKSSTVPDFYVDKFWGKMWKKDVSVEKIMRNDVSKMWING